VTASIFKQAMIDALVKLLPQNQWRNPVMFVVFIGSVLTTILWFQALRAAASAGRLHPRHHVVAVVHGAVRQLRRSDCRRSQQSQADALRAAKRDTIAKKLRTAALGRVTRVNAAALRAGDAFLVEAGDFIPADGDVIEGVRRSTNRRSPANRHRSSANRAATSVR
jgi:K+-transporting ATPase ATPase B chain